MFHQEEKCGNCIFYLASAKICRHSPPIPIMVGVKQGIALAPGGQEPLVISYFPPMMPHGWCGQYKLREEMNNVENS